MGIDRAGTAREPLPAGHVVGAGAWRVEALEALDVRSWRRAELSLPDGLVLITGPNGAGKTTLLEAIALGLVGVSPRTSKEAEIVRDGSEALFVRLATDGPRGPHVREIGYSPGLGRRMRIDERPARSVRAFRAHGSVLAFLPDELRVVKGPPSARRRHLDRLLEGALPGYVEHLSGYTTATAQRNALLRRIRAGEVGEAELDVWDAQVADLGAEVSSARRAALTALTEPFGAYLGRLGGGSGGALSHEPSPGMAAEAADEELGDVLLARLRTTRPRDIAAAQTLSGPHRDDIGIFAAGSDLRRFGSQGEQRTAALALVLAHRDHLAARAARPLVLLDDALSELDETRRGLVLDALDGDGQTIITSADPAVAAPAGARATKHVRVERGRIVDG